MEMNRRTRLRSGLSTILTVIVAATSLATLRTTAYAATAPPAFLSDYVQSMNYSAWENYGCQQVQYSTSTGAHTMLLILDFGQPAAMSGAEGTNYFAAGYPFSPWNTGTTSGNQFLVAEFLTGYWNCHVSGSTFIHLGIGTSTYGSNVTNGNAAAMAAVVNNVESWITSNGWGGFMAAESALDIEGDTGWSGVAGAEGYESTLGGTTQKAIYDYGGAVGCPTGSYQTGVANCLAGWGQADYYWAAWQYQYAFAAPEIYEQTYASNAQQWFQISLMGAKNAPQGAIAFSASTTQYTACQQVGVSNCPDTDNNPAQGWMQLFNWINSDTATAMTPAWSIDFRYLG